MIKEVEKILKSAGIEEASTESKLIVTEVSGLTIEEIILDKTIKNKEKILEIASMRAKTRMPLQYILGFSYFMGHKYKVNKDVLIPREETEFLVNEGFEKAKEKKEKINILEIGTGTGCISIELAGKLENRNVEILSVDISTDAIQVALENAQNLNVIRKVIFRKSDIFSKIRQIEKFDLIISNPPYIPKRDKIILQKEVMFEPAEALFTDDEDGIEYYKKIIKDARNFLKEKGSIAFELGQGQSEKVKKIFEESNFRNIKIIKDLAGIERVISADI